MRNQHQPLGKLFGFNVQSERVWQERHRITSARREGRSGVNWMCTCEAPGCSRTYRLSSFFHKRTALCKTCSYRGRCKRPFEAQYNCFKKKTEARRKLRVELTYEEFASLCAAPACHYCHVAIERAPTIVQKGSGSNATCLDRKDNNGPYTVENTVPCCILCNLTKGSLLTYQEMLVIGAIRRNDRHRAAGYAVAAADHNTLESLKYSKFHTIQMRFYNTKVRAP